MGFTLIIKGAKAPLNTPQKELHKSGVNLLDAMEKPSKQSFSPSDA